MLPDVLYVPVVRSSGLPAAALVECVSGVLLFLVDPRCAPTGVGTCPTVAATGESRMGLLVLLVVACVGCMPLSLLLPAVP